jgi:hypothetical protein
MDPLEEMHYEYKINVLDETDRKYYEDNFLNQDKEDDSRSHSSGDFADNTNSDKSFSSDDSKASSCG